MGSIRGPRGEKSLFNTKAEDRYAVEGKRVRRFAEIHIQSGPAVFYGGLFERCTDVPAEEEGKLPCWDGKAVRWGQQATLSGYGNRSMWWIEHMASRINREVGLGRRGWIAGVGPLAIAFEGTGAGDELVESGKGAGRPLIVTAGKLPTYREVRWVDAHSLSKKVNVVLVYPEKMPIETEGGEPGFRGPSRMYNDLLPTECEVWVLSREVTLQEAMEAVAAADSGRLPVKEVRRLKVQESVERNGTWDSSGEPR